MTSKIPPLLEPYLALPPGAALVVLTGVLGASTNWLVLRCLHAYLSPPSAPPPPPPPPDDGSGAGGGEACVLLVSFMRGYAFWRDGAGRLGTDLEALARRGRFAFVDGLGGLFLPPAAAPSPPASHAGPPGGTGRLMSPRVADVGRALHAAVDKLAAGGPGGGGGGGETRRVVLVVDQLDLLLAATDEEGAGAALADMLLDLREKVHATVLTLAADGPLVAAQGTPLERGHAALALALAHEADAVLGLRLLDTGAARDVSGVVRITRGGGAVVSAAAGGGPGAAVEEHEYLYHVGGDGGVRVFERGQ